jgi:tetratricopeptide (TPR) repeat protein
LRFTRPNACKRSWSSPPGHESPGRPASRVASLLVLCALAALVTGCAYFNTFYHARKFYRQAEKTQRESKSDKLSPDAARSYDKAIEKASKVIFEQGGGWRAGIDDALFLQGQCYYGKREYDTAIKKFNELVLNFPETNHIPEALFYTGLCYHHMHNYPTARRLFERLLRTYPDFERRDEIVLTVAQGMDAAGETEQALAEYRQLVEHFEDSERRVDALERVGQIHYDAGRFDSALVAYTQLAQIAREDEVYFQAQLNVGACLVRLGQAERALSVYERIVPEDLHSEDAGRVALAMAEANSRRGEYDTAAELLTRVSQDFVNRTLGIEADFRLGYTYEVYQQRYDLARAAYEKAARAATESVFKNQAARRLTNLKHLEELQASADTLSAQEDLRAAAALQVAEFSYFESDDREKAFGEYQLVEREFPQSEFAARAAYARAWIMQSDYDSSAAAAALYDSLVSRYPASPQAQRALVHLRELGHPETRLLALETLSRSAQARQHLVDDSLAAVQAVADSLAAVAAAIAEAATKATADSLARVQSAGARSRVAFEAAAAATAAIQEAAAVSAAEKARLDSLAAALSAPAPSAPPARVAAPGDSVSAPEDSASLAISLAPAPEDSASLAISLAPAPGDSMGLPGVSEPVPMDPEQLEALLAPERVLSAARITAARARADSVRAWAGGVVDSVAQAQAEQESRRAALAAAAADSVARARARADSLADQLAAERRAARAIRATEKAEESEKAEEQVPPADSSGTMAVPAPPAGIPLLGPAARGDTMAIPAPDSSGLPASPLPELQGPPTPEPEKP